jgi:nitroreductase
MLEAGNIWESRPTPSGGGCHPIEIIVLKAPALNRRVLIYDAEHHAFGVRELSRRSLLAQCVSEVEVCLETRRGSILWFVPDLGKSGARYHNPESLAWRDSGALLATVALVAEGMGLDCCGLGLHDIPSLRRFLRLGEGVIGVGGCVLGARKGGATR